MVHILHIQLPSANQSQGTASAFGVSILFYTVYPRFCCHCSPTSSTDECLKSYLTSTPVLAYPDFSSDFILETDACVLRLGAILSQWQEDGSIHPFAYASRSLSQLERNYGITVAVVWAFSHFRAHLYGHKVTVYTNHSTVTLYINQLFWF